MSGSLLVGMWPGDDMDPLASPSANIYDKKSALLQVSACCEYWLTLNNCASHRFRLKKTKLKFVFQKTVVICE